MNEDGSKTKFICIGKFLLCSLTIEEHDCQWRDSCCLPHESTTPGESETFKILVLVGLEEERPEPLLFWKSLGPL